MIRKLFNYIIPSLYILMINLFKPRKLDLPVKKHVFWHKFEFQSFSNPKNYLFRRKNGTKLIHYWIIKSRVV